MKYNTLLNVFNLSFFFFHYTVQIIVLTFLSITIFCRLSLAKVIIILFYVYLSDIDTFQQTQSYYPKIYFFLSSFSVVFAFVFYKHFFFSNTSCALDVHS